MKTHKVLDLVYTKEEGQDCYAGTHNECLNFVNKQGGAAFMFKIVPLIKQELEVENAKLSKPLNSKL